MNAMTRTSAIALALLLPLSACSRTQQAMQDAGNQIDQGKITAQIQQGIDKAKQELETKNISINNGGVNINGHDVVGRGTDTLPKAEITPQGELLIDGKSVAATPEQKALLLDYRKRIINIAETGMDIGAQGAALGIDAAKHALLGVFSGKDDKDIEASIKPQTDKIEAAAKQLCSYMPGLLDAQHKLAASLPPFQPYATMTQKDVDDCNKDDENGEKGFAVFSK